MKMTFAWITGAVLSLTISNGAYAASLQALFKDHVTSEEIQSFKTAIEAKYPHAAVKARPLTGTFFIEKISLAEAELLKDEMWKSELFATVAPGPGREDITTQCGGSL